jgi:sugar phosphate isomerase/epimerase
MGEGCIPLRQMRAWVEEAGFNGFVEVEIFSNEFWAMDQTQYVERVKAAWLDHA